MITVPASNYADKWLILICHNDEVMYVTITNTIAVFNIKPFGQEVTLCLCCVDPRWSDLTVEAEIAGI